MLSPPYSQPTCLSWQPVWTNFHKASRHTVWRAAEWPPVFSCQGLRDLIQHHRGQGRAGCLVLWVASLLHPPRNENGAGRGRGPGTSWCSYTFRGGPGSLACFWETARNDVHAHPAHDHAFPPRGPSWPQWVSVAQEMASAVKHQTRSTATFSRCLGELFTEQMLCYADLCPENSTCEESNILSS